MLSGVIPLVIDRIAGKVVESLVKDPYIPVQHVDRPVMKPAVEEILKQEMTPTLQHLTNNEPWYKSRVTWGALGAILGGTATIVTAFANGDGLNFEIVGPAAMSVLGGIGGLYGRWAATKPIGA